MMKINRISAPLLDFVDEPALVRLFLSQLVDSQEQLNELFEVDDPICEDKAIKDAITFIEDAFEKNAKVMVCGDYDCDGITSTTMTIRLLEKVGFKLGVDCGYYIPNRLSEGYGASASTIQRALDKGYTHFIFVDNGVKAFEAIDAIAQGGASLLVIDHHQYDQPLKIGNLLHPDLLSPYYTSLCGAGLMYVLSKAMHKLDDEMIILACIGTIGDVMPLRHQNRVIVKKGIDLLNENPPLTITSLLKRKVTRFDATQVSFQIVPVFNAVGRLADVGNVNQVVKYLLSEEEAQIRQFAQQMLSLNDQRKLLGQEMSSMAYQQMSHHRFQIIYEPSFHEGLVGIVAGQIARSTNKPTLVLTKSGDLVKGSARSPFFDVYRFLEQFKGYFTSFGGHPNAAAVSLPLEQFEAFRSEVNDHMDEIEWVDPLINALEVEDEWLTLNAFEALDKYAPYGAGFELIDIVLDCKIKSCTKINSSGFKWLIEPIGEVNEIVMFGVVDVHFLIASEITFVGKLQKGFRKGLTLNASYVLDR